jgi:hypothetical protein
VLASRIAALNMLGITLDHLGVVTTLPDGSRNEPVWAGLEALVKSVGSGEWLGDPQPTSAAEC